MKILSLMSESYGSNCYVLVDDVVAVIDPGLMPDRVVNETRELHINALVFINTHCHFDHSGCIPELLERLGGEYLLHEKDAEAVERGLDDFLLAGLFGEKAFRLEVSRRLRDGDVVDLRGSKLEVLHTPGHTAGSICLYEPETKSLFTGDTLFADGVGRTDFPGGDSKALMSSLERLVELCETRGVDKVYPGHGPVGKGRDISRVFEMFSRI